MTLKYLSRSRVQYRRTVGPTPRRTMHPLNHVVAHVHRIGTVRQHFDAVGVLVASCLKRLCPPAGALEQRGPHRFRRTRIKIVDNRFDSLADLGLRIDFLQAMPAPETPDQ